MTNIIFNTNKISETCLAKSFTESANFSETVAGKAQSVFFAPTAKSEQICVYIRNDTSSICYVKFGKGDYVSAKDCDKVFIEPHTDFIAFVDTGACLKNDGSIELIFTPESSASLASLDLTVKVIEFLPVVNH